MKKDEEKEEKEEEVETIFISAYVSSFRAFGGCFCLVCFVFAPLFYSVLVFVFVSLFDSVCLFVYLFVCLFLIHVSNINLWNQSHSVIRLATL